MTCIAGIVDKKTVWMGGDSLASFHHNWNCMTDSSPKVFRNGPFLIGTCGSIRFAQLLRYSLNLADDARCKDAMRFISVDFVNALRRLLGEHGAKKKEGEVEQTDDGSCLLGFRGRLFAVYGDFCVTERIEGYDSIGCGGQLALGSLHESSRGKMKPEYRLKRALEAAERFSAGVRGPFTILKMAE